MLKTAECVSPKHPDKMCDQISDAILDAYLKQDPESRVAVETMGGHGKVYLTGEVTSKGNVSHAELEDIVQRISETSLFDINIVVQSPEIAQGVDTGGAGDQGIMNGFACLGNKEYVPLEYYYARSLCKSLYKKFPYDGKTQVTIGEMGEIETIVASFQNTTQKELQDAVNIWIDAHRADMAINHVIHANPAGDWKQGGFDADAGLTGRKIAIDNYGPMIPIGGGAFSGKDATKVDRSAAYMARMIAKELLIEEKKLDLKSGIDSVFVQLAYAIGVREPVQAIAHKNYKDGKTVSEEVTGYDLTPRGISVALDLKKPQYEKTAKWGHFGNDFTWDK